MHRTLIAARLQEARDIRGIAETFAESDATELPHMVGVSRRTLFSFHDLYFHLVEADQDIKPDLDRARKHPLYTQVSETLTQFVWPYDPNWKEPRDAMADAFYVWTAEKGREL